MKECLICERIISKHKIGRRDHKGNVEKPECIKIMSISQDIKLKGKQALGKLYSI